MALSRTDDPPPDLRVVCVLKSDGFAETRLVELEGAHWLHKRFRFRFVWGRPLGRLARWCMLHEAANCRRLAGIEGTASRVRIYDRTSFLREWIPGEDVKAAKRARIPLRDDFFDALEAILEEVHRRGVAYNDLAKPENVLVTEAGAPALIDYQISLRTYRGRVPGVAPIVGWWVARLQREDRRHLLKLKARRRPDLLTGDERLALQRNSALRAGFLPFWHLAHRMKRLAYPKNSDEVFRFQRRR